MVVSHGSQDWWEGAKIQAVLAYSPADNDCLALETTVTLTEDICCPVCPSPHHSLLFLQR